MTDTTADIVSFPTLIAAMSMEKKAPSVYTEEQIREKGIDEDQAIATSKLKLLSREEREAITSLTEMFPTRTLTEILDTYFSCDKDIAVVSNILLQEPESKHADQVVAIPELGDNQVDLSKSPPILLASSSVLAARFDFIKQLNEDFKACYEVINFSQVDKFFSVASLLAKNRTFLLYNVKSELFNSSLGKSVGSGDLGEVIIHRAKALKFTAKGECDLEGRWSIFGQAFRILHGKPVAAFRRSDQLFKVLFAGERGHDAGGLYREAWSMMCQELMSSTLPLLLPCANSK
jgi:hypothetical protein